MSSGLTGEAILAAADAQLVPMDVPEWKGTVHLRTMQAAERDAFELGSTAVRGRTRVQKLDNIRARLCAYCLADADGNPLFADPEKVAEQLGQKNGAVLERLWERARAMNALNKEDVEDLAKN